MQYITFFILVGFLALSNPCSFKETDILTTTTTKPQQPLENGHLKYTMNEIIPGMLTYTWSEINFGEWGDPQQAGWLRPGFKNCLVCSNHDKKQTLFFHL